MHIVIAIFCIWLVSRLLGGLARRLKQPAIIGELLTGLLLGPPLLGRYYSFTSPFLDGLVLASTGLFLLTAGWGLRLSEILIYRRLGLAVSLAGVLVPFTIGYVLGSSYPNLAGYDGLSSMPLFAVFLGIALSVSALPVIARTLMDLGLYRSRIGVITMSAVTIDDLLGWTCFSFLLSFFGHMSLRTQLTFFLPLACYVIGVLIGEVNDGRHAKVKHAVDRAVQDVFAPIVFGSIALKLSFIQNFDLRLVLVLVLAASTGKVFGCFLAARAMRIPRRESWAVGFAMNSRGAMMIILASLAWQLHVIGDRLVVGLIAMAVVTSLMSAPLIRWALKKETIVGAEQTR